jgi:hypothetical protein
LSKGVDLRFPLLHVAGASLMLSSLLVSSIIAVLQSVGRGKDAIVDSIDKMIDDSGNSSGITFGKHTKTPAIILAPCF